MSTDVAKLWDTFSQITISDEDQALVEDLLRISAQSPKLIRSSLYDAPADPSIKIRSWKMNEFKYYNVPSPFPTLARGLFTQDIELDGAVRHRIVARGYDKFFNIGEVPWTTWASLEAHTKPPYTLTLKSNGCIIFIAALTPDKLLVTSKHSLGHLANVPGESHAEVGERWLRTHLKQAGKTEEQLAAVLWEKKWTAVAELCDDSFEEHVLPYSKENTGLHLHGLNECTKSFRTQLPDVVDAFAHEWGFIPTAHTELKTMPEVKEFTEEIGRSGTWRGQALEGFVVRTHVSEPPTRRPGQDVRASPYAPGSSFFFKVKFDEPYMMYRDWREVTKTLLSKGPTLSNVPKGKLRRAETKLYAKWVINEIKRDKAQFADFSKGKGIIATRERFLKWLDSGDGKLELENTAEEETVQVNSDQKKFGKTIIVPVAIPGVGKTTIAVALTHLFGFGHTQSDDIRAKKPAPQFIKSVTNLLKTYDVVIADKNNHQKQHRQALRDATKDMDPPVRLLALNWSFDIPPSTVHRICGDRVLARGENHQSLRADVSGKAHEGVIWMFLKDGEELLDSEVDEVVEMDIEDSLEDALARAIAACVRILGVPRPSVEQVGEALAAAHAYEPKVTATAKSKGKTKAQPAAEPAKKKKEKAPRYYAFLPEVDLERLLEKRLKDPEAPDSAREFFAHLCKDKRVTATPHVTIVHEKGLPADQDLWDRCKAIYASPAPPLFLFHLTHVVWDDRVMALVVHDLAVSNGGDDPETAEFVKKLEEEGLLDKMHVTVGTRRKNIAPFEARDLVQRWRKGDEKVGCLELKDTTVVARVKGLNG